MVALSLSELHRSRVALRFELADDLPPVTGDRVQLQQVILNLLLNATEAKSSVDGVERLFEAFYTTKSGGMGIGLSVSRSIIEIHHGRLWAAPNDGPGATFSFSIPCKPESLKSGHRDGVIRPPAVVDAQPVI